jgi:hypothetical protein
MPYEGYAARLYLALQPSGAKGLDHYGVRRDP